MRPVYFIFFTILIDSLGIGIIFPVMATLLSQITGEPINDAAAEGGLLMAVYAGMQFVFAPVLGGISDRYGRRPVLLLSLLGLGLDYVILIYADSYAWLVAGRALAGICGGSFTTAFAYIADTTEPEKRAQAFGMLGAAFGLGFIIGPFVGGIVSDFGPRAPFVVAASLSFLNFMYGFFILPESLPVSNRRKFDIRRANPFGAFVHLARMKNIRWLVVSMFLIYLAGQVMPAVWTFYTKYLFGWSDKAVGYSLAFVGVMVALVQGGLIRVSQKMFGPVRSIYIGFILYVTGLFLFAFANQEWMMYVWTFIYALGGIAPPSLQSIISTEVPSNEQGELQGILTSLMSLATVISPIIMTLLFAHFTSKDASVVFPGAPFLAAGVLMIFAMLLYATQQRRKVAAE